MMKILQQIIDYFLSSPGLVLFGAVTIIQIAPIKINPWGFALNAIRRFLVGDLEKEIKEQREDIQTLKNDFAQEKADNKRWNILDYANSCRNNRRHSKDEWHHVISQLKEYETFVAERGIDNGVMEEEARYLRKNYAEHCEQNDFL